MDHLNTAQQPQPRQQQQQQQHQLQPQITPPHTIVNLGAQPSQQQVPYQLIPQDPLGYAPPNQSPSANVRGNDLQPFTIDLRVGRIPLQEDSNGSLLHCPWVQGEGGRRFPRNDGCTCVHASLARNLLWRFLVSVPGCSASTGSSQAGLLS